MHDCDRILRGVMLQAAALKIPFSKQVEPHVVINRRAVTRFGCCRYSEGRYIIEVAERVAEGPEKACWETLAHELLHTCYGCRNHGAQWRSYAKKMNEAYGYTIARVSSNQDLGVKEARACRYILRCEACGKEIKRFRASRLTEHPERYRCKCGGKLRMRTGEVQREEA